MKKFLMFAAVVCCIAVAAQEFTIMQWNIHIGIDMHGKYNLLRQAEVILEHDPDIVVLNEVDKNCPRTGCADQAKELGLLTGMFSSFGGARILPPEGLYGNAILSRYRVTPVRTWFVPHAPDETRACTLWRIEAKQPFYVLGTHLSYQQVPEIEKIRIQSLDRIFEIIDQEVKDQPVVIIGDLNSEWRSAPIEHMLAKGWIFAGNNPSFPAPKPKRVLDYFAVRKNDTAITIKKHYPVDEKVASDHIPLVTVIEVKGK